MTETEETKPTPPHGARLLEIGETIRDGDLHWNSTEKHWLAVTPQGEEKVEPGAARTLLPTKPRSLATTQQANERPGLSNADARRGRREALRCAGG